MEQEEIPHYKVVIIGNSGCGKTAIILRWISDKFVRESKPTVGSNHQRKRVVLDGTGPVDLYVWDTAGQEQFQALMPIYTRGAMLAIVTAAIDDAQSFEAIPHWIETIQSACDSPPPMILAVNKMDMVESAALSMEEIKERYDNDFAGIFFVSALTGENIDQLFRLAAVEAVKFAQTVVSAKVSVLGNEQEVVEKGCC